MGFCAVLSLILIVAKLFSLVTLSWWICLAPVIISVALKLIFMLVIWIIAFIVTMKGE